MELAAQILTEVWWIIVLFLTACYELFIIEEWWSRAGGGIIDPDDAHQLN